MEAHAVTPTSSWWTYLGNRDYQETWDRQEAHRAKIFSGEAKDHLFLVEHPPTITLGRAEKGQNLRAPAKALEEKGFRVIETSRGGQITYHGPGQLVAYPIFQLRKFGGVKCFVHGLEETMLLCLKELGLKAQRKEGFPGAWIGEKKIGSIGLHVRKQVSIHGLALNVHTDLSHFSFITPCGLPGVKMTSVEKEGVAVTVKGVIDPFVKAFTHVFGKKIDG